MNEETSQDSGTDTSHRRRRMLAAHHKEFIGEDPREPEREDDAQCLMAMERDSSPRSSSSGPNPVAAVDTLPEEDNNGRGRMKVRRGTEALGTDQAGHTNLDDELCV